jgi:predicted  nucleic acid-binding Zn-ribbon protein
MSVDTGAAIAAAEAEMADFAAEKKAVEERIRDLRSREDFKNGVYFPKEIFEAQQDKLRLETEILFRQNAIRRLRLGVE